MFLGILIAQAANNAQALKEVTETAQKVVETNIADNATAVTASVSIWTHILSADPLVKMTLILLLGFSVACWAIIFLKLGQLKVAQRASLAFWQKFSASPSISQSSAQKMARTGPLYEIFQSAQEALAKIKGVTNSYSSYYKEFLFQRITQAKEEEIYKLEQYVSFLATTASVAPFIGLFGTVWGILTAFLAIGKAGSSSLATVGPYIAEALVATAVGLFAAIPAVVAYNYFVGKIKVISTMIDLFIDDYVLKSEKEFT